MKIIKVGNGKYSYLLATLPLLFFSSGLSLLLNSTNPLHYRLGIASIFIGFIWLIPDLYIKLNYFTFSKDHLDLYFFGKKTTIEINKIKEIIILQNYYWEIEVQNLQI